MLAAGTEPQAKLCLVQHDIGGNQHKQRYQHEPVKLKRTDIHEKSLLRLSIYDGRGHIVHALRCVHRPHQNNCYRWS